MSEQLLIIATTMNNWIKTFVIIWTGQLFSILTSTVVGFSLVLWLTFKTESAEVLALATVAALLPQALLGLVSGVFVDRWDRKTTMILADSFIALCTLLLAVLFFLGAAEIWHIYLLLSLRSVGSAFHSPAMQASVPLLAPAKQLPRIAGVSQMINSICNIAGPALAALLIGLFDINYILLLDVAGAIIACTSLLFVKIPRPERKEFQKLNIWRDLKEALNGVKSVNGLVTLVLFSILGTFVIMPIGALFPLMTLEHFSGNAFQISIVEVAWGVGALLGGAIMAVMPLRSNKVMLINASYLLLGFTFFASGLLSLSGFWLFVILTLFGGLSGGVYYASFMAVVQTRVEPHILGRVFSAYGSISLLPSMIGLLFTGFIADNIGITTTFIISGAVLVGIGFISYFFPTMMSLGKTE